MTSARADQPRSTAVQPDRPCGVAELHVGRRRGPFPPPGTFTAVTARANRAGVHDDLSASTTTRSRPTPTPPTISTGPRSTAATRSRSTSRSTAAAARPSTDPIKTGSVYGFRNLNSQSVGDGSPGPDKGIWHEFEIRTIGQQYTILVDGQMINQFDNAIPKIASRAGDPPTMARQFARAISASRPTAATTASPTARSRSRRLRRMRSRSTRSRRRSPARATRVSR